ncbi:unnamed protein product [Tetraodon nigroviridis]|uniref:(spotted green pufferfish) hypothetical protein n=1 Tax=Tetraodon nigroviridis TaxID=99883 RepID=Q4THL3_TETNG|nr:unnamed protein product [Tetraodon nigroviridis]
MTEEVKEGLEAFFSSSPQKITTLCSLNSMILVVTGVMKKFSKRVKKVFKAPEGRAEEGAVGGGRRPGAGAPAARLRLLAQQGAGGHRPRPGIPRGLLKDGHGDPGPVGGHRHPPGWNQGQEELPEGPRRTCFRSSGTQRREGPGIDQGLCALCNREGSEPHPLRSQGGSSVQRPGSPGCPGSHLAPSLGRVGTPVPDGELLQEDGQNHPPLKTARSTSPGSS